MKITEGMVEAGCRAMHEAQGSEDADAPLHSPYQNSWDEPDSVRWRQWDETVREVLAAALAAAEQPVAALIDSLSDEQLRHIADSKDTASCRGRIRSALASPAQPAPPQDNGDNGREQKMTAETALRVLREFDAHDYAEDYEFCADGDYKPSEQEKTLIEDAILGALGTVEERIRAASNAREDFEFAGQAGLDAAIRELELAQVEIERVRRHLGNVLLVLAELHQDDRCRALDEALTYYNASCPDKQIAPVDGYVTRLVQHGPFDTALAEDANA